MLDIKTKFFKLSEFDCPLEGEGSGSRKMNLGFILLLDKARLLAGVPFRITSGYRSKKYNQSLINRGFKASKNSSHLKGLAADIKTENSNNRYLIVASLLQVGINRIGIGKTFVHCDIDESKIDEVMWDYY